MYFYRVKFGKENARGLMASWSLCISGDVQKLTVVCVGKVTSPSMLYFVYTRDSLSIGRHCSRLEDCHTPEVGRSS